MTPECVIYLGKRGVPEEIGASLSAEQRTSIHWRPAAAFFSRLEPTDVESAVLIADNTQSDQFEAIRNAPPHVVTIAKDRASAQALGQRVDFSIADLSDPATTARLLDVACRLANSRQKGAQMTRQLARTDEEYRELGRTGLALMSVHNIDALIKLILQQGKQLTESDGGAFLFVESDEHGAQVLRPVAYAVDSLRDVTSTPLTYPIDNTSMIGYAALTREPVVVANSRDLPPGTPFTASDALRTEYGYWARSMLAVPMSTQQGALLGVLAFFNRKSDSRVVITAENEKQYLLPYEDRHVRLTRAFASMAAVSIENARLHSQIEHIFESFVKAAVSAVDARDPTTAGHSLRVAALTASIAEAVERGGRGPYRDLRFNPMQMRQLRFAALLHDIGKVAIREDVLVKAKKLPPVLWERIDARFDLIRRTLELELCKRRTGQCGRRTQGDEALGRVNADLEARLQELDSLKEIVRAANEPAVLTEAADIKLNEVARRSFPRADGRDEPYLTAEELHFLQISRGTLDEHERVEIESHVNKTYQFLNSIPWTKDLKDLVTYASGHHEKLNGRGYPRKLLAQDIPLQSRMMTVSDIYDALTANDRPYKRAISTDRALDILKMEVADGFLDPTLVDLFMDAKVYERAGVLRT